MYLPGYLPLDYRHENLSLAIAMTLFLSDNFDVSILLYGQDKSFIVRLTNFAD